MATKGTYRFKCSGCNKMVIVTLSLHHTAPCFCTPICKKTSKALRAKLLPVPCPRPEKLAWDNTEIGGSKAHAKAVKYRKTWKPEDNVVIKVYLCRCGKIHIGNFAYKFMGYS